MIVVANRPLCVRVGRNLGVFAWVGRSQNPPRGSIPELRRTQVAEQVPTVGSVCCASQISRNSQEFGGIARRLELAGYRLILDARFALLIEFQQVNGLPVVRIREERQALEAQDAGKATSRRVGPRLIKDGLVVSPEIGKRTGHASTKVFHQ